MSKETVQDLIYSIENYSVDVPTILKRLKVISETSQLSSAMPKTDDDIYEMAEINFSDHKSKGHYEMSDAKSEDYFCDGYLFGFKAAFNKNQVPTDEEMYPIWLQDHDDSEDMYDAVRYQIWADGFKKCKEYIPPVQMQLCTCGRPLHISTHCSICDNDE